MPWWTVRGQLVDSEGLSPRSVLRGSVVRKTPDLGRVRSRRSVASIEHRTGAEPERPHRPTCSDYAHDYRVRLALTSSRSTGETSSRYVLVPAMNVTSPSAG